MRKSGYRTIFHIYVIFFLSLLGTVIAAVAFSFMLITVRQPDGTRSRSDWPKVFTENFREQIVFIDNAPQVKQSGIALLHENDLGLQIISPLGKEVFSYERPSGAGVTYSISDLLSLCQGVRSEDGQTTGFAGTVTNGGKEYIYILYFPVNIAKVTMYLNGEQFAGGKLVVLAVFVVLLLAIVGSGVLYGFMTTRAMKKLTASIEDIASRSYLPIQKQGAFHDLYKSLNTLDAQIRTSDQLRTQTEKMREEWIANITHDLKTPLSPIKGYAEILLETDGKSAEQCRRYAGIVMKNVSYMETLIEDLKLTYQLENGMLPLNCQEQNLVRFLRELAIDILNDPEYEDRIIHFECAKQMVRYSFDQMLFQRAFGNLIVNAFVHGRADTEITLRVADTEDSIQISVRDNGGGMSTEECAHLFERYYRGASTEKRPEGTGLGLAIAKNIIERHGGKISVSSVLGLGTTFYMEFPV
ncbi:MAG: HAMP domain-containing sensor histidine kinase [Lachnospiraceae bacterium]|jgi:signal transduction histidine kinase|nr:HAMP domain-containing sensor histidine kinase [Lachnospiraceae bacterium]